MRNFLGPSQIHAILKCLARQQKEGGLWQADTFISFSEITCMKSDFVLVT